MKVLLNKNPKEIIAFDDLKGDELICYKSHSTNNFCVLTKLYKMQSTISGRNHFIQEHQYGFIRLNSSTFHPWFCEETWFKSVRKFVRKAAECRDVYAFKNVNEMLEFILNEQKI